MPRRQVTVAAFLYVTLSLTIYAGAQAPREPVDQEMVARIKEEGLQRSQVMETLSYLTDVYGPRLTGSPEIKRASEWAISKMTQWGLADAHLEAWGPFGRGWSLEGFTANMIEPSYSPLIAYPKAWSPSTAETICGEPIYFDATKDEDLAAFRGKLKGAIVLLSPPRELKAWFEAQGVRTSDERLLALANADPSIPAGSGPGGPPGRGLRNSPEQRAAAQMQGKKWQMLYAEGAAVVLEAGRGDGGTLFVQSVTMPVSAEAASAPFGSSRGPRPWAKDAPAAIPQVVVAAEHYNRLVRMIQKRAPVKLQVALQTRFHEDDLMAHNVIAEIAGTDLKDEIVMLGAHFDSWHSGTGATDNAAGSGVCMEAMRILRAVNAKPRRTIRIALWSGEEEGLLGSRAYVSDHFGRRIDAAGPRPASVQAAAASGGGSNEPQQNATPGGASEGLRTQRTPGKYELKSGHAKFSAYFNLDNGTGKIRGVHLQGNEDCRPIFRAWLAPFKDLGASTITLTNTGGTDHLSFDGIGLPGFQFIQDPIEYETRTHHSNMDVYERIQEEDLKQAAVIMASFAFHAAMRDEKLPRKPLVGEIVTSLATE
jgi:hypothetical protein